MPFSTRDLAVSRTSGSWQALSNLHIHVIDPLTYVGRNGNRDPA